MQLFYGNAVHALLAQISLKPCRMLPTQQMPLLLLSQVLMCSTAAGLNCRQPVGLRALNMTATIMGKLDIHMEDINFKTLTRDKVSVNLEEGVQAW